MAIAYNQIEAFPRWVAVSVSYSFMATAATSNNRTILKLQPKQVVHDVVIKHSKEFIGGAIATYTLSVGITGNLTKYATPFNVFQATGATVFGLGALTEPTPENFSSTTDVKAEAVCTGADLDQATQGGAIVYILISTLP